ncbi:MAG: helix-turn-helix transcriptional regulator [Clostridium celatum]|nr:helix-turn-helix transcriptional regulator [Clostridium celatum]
MKLGRKIRDIRVSRNMTQKKLAESAGISNTYLSDIERMRTSPSIKTLENIANSLGKNIKEFLD